MKVLKVPPMQGVAEPDGLKPLKVKIGGIEKTLTSFLPPDDYSAIIELNAKLPTGPVHYAVYVRFYSTTCGEDADLVEFRAVEHHDCNCKYLSKDMDTSKNQDGQAVDQAWLKIVSIEDWPAVVEFV